MIIRVLLPIVPSEPSAFLCHNGFKSDSGFRIYAIAYFIFLFSKIFIKRIFACITHHLK